MPRDRTTLAIFCCLSALFFFEAMGLIIKHLSPSYSAAELSAYRNLIGLIPALLVLWVSPSWRSRKNRWAMRQWQIPILRGVVLTMAQYSFYLALGLMNFATASTITYANALFMVALAVPFLGEKVGVFRWAAVMIGFAGVVLVMGPGRESFSSVAILPLIAALCYALAGVLARLVDDDVPTPLINLYSSFYAAIGAFLLALATGGFSEIQSGTDLMWMLGMGAFGGTAVLLLVAAYRMAEQSDLAPFTYFGIPFAFALGWLFFDEAPWSELFPGALLIIAGGLMIIWRERRLRGAA